MTTNRSANVLAGALVAILFLLLQPSLVSADSWQGSIESIDGVTCVLNPATGASSPKTLELKEVWRLGGDSDDPNEFFGLINSIRSDEEGNLYLLDAQLLEIKIFSPEGDFLRVIGREGEGPGEFRNPTGIVFLPNGNIGVTIMVPGKIVALTPDGDPAEDYPIPQPDQGGFSILQSANNANGNFSIVIGSNAFTQGEMVQTWDLVRIDDSGNRLEQFATNVSTLNFANALIDETVWDGFQNRWSMGPDGRVYTINTWGEYAISVHNPDGTLDKVIKRSIRHRTRDEDEIALVNEIWSAFLQQVPNAQIKISDYDQDVFRTYARNDGTLWVQNSYGSWNQPDDTIGSFDVFDENGRFMREITLKGQGNPRRDGYFFIDDRLYVVTGFLEAMIAQQTGARTSLSDVEEAEPMTVICYKLDLNTL
ncbi:MAG: hypothetical protein GY835_01590 [bacterium]|nr:hypothetical protein [bacterium]